MAVTLFETRATARRAMGVAIIRAAAGSVPARAGDSPRTAARSAGVTASAEEVPCPWLDPGSVKSDPQNSLVLCRCSNEESGCHTLKARRSRDQSVCSSNDGRQSTSPEDMIRETAAHCPAVVCRGKFSHGRRQSRRVAWSTLAWPRGRIEFMVTLRVNHAANRAVFT